MGKRMERRQTGRDACLEHTQTPAQNCHPEQRKKLVISFILNHVVSTVTCTNHMYKCISTLQQLWNSLSGITYMYIHNVVQAIVKVYKEQILQIKYEFMVYFTTNTYLPRNIEKVDVRVKSGHEDGRWHTQADHRHWCGEVRCRIHTKCTYTGLVESTHDNVFSVQPNHSASSPPFWTTPLSYWLGGLLWLIEGQRPFFGESGQVATTWAPWHGKQLQRLSRIVMYMNDMAIGKTPCTELTLTHSNSECDNEYNFYFKTVTASTTCSWYLHVRIGY